MPPAPCRSGKSSLLAIAVFAAVAYGAGAASIWVYSLKFAPPVDRSTGRNSEMSGEKVVALGRIRPAGGIRSVSGPPGDQIAQVLVKERQWVTAEQPLVRLASQLDRKDEMDLLDQQIKDAEAQIGLVEASGKGEIGIAEAKFNDQTSLAPLDVQAQRTRVKLLKEQQESAERKLTNMRELRLSSPNIVAAQDVEGQELLLNQAKAELEAGEALLKKSELALETGKKVAEAQLAAAKANLERGRREIPLESLKKKRELADLQYNRTVLKAPAAGMVIKIAGRDGDPTAPQQTILELADTKTMQVVAEVYETDVAKLRKMREVGQPRVFIRSMALPRESPDKPPKDLTGTITSIGSMIARNTVFDVDPTADTDRRVFEVVVTIDKPDDITIAAQFLNLQVQVFFEPSK